jgi:archaellum biogenesis protein FlaJ (TadC family)
MPPARTRPSALSRPLGLYHAVGRRLPPDLRRNMRKQLDYAGQRLDAETWLGTVLVATFLFGIVFALTALIVFQVTDRFLLAVAFLCGIFLTPLAVYTHLTSQIDDRKNRIERILPDALHIISANIRAGMNPLVALRLAARPEFGPLEEEIKYATARALGTENITEIFRDMGTRIPSPLFQRAINLMAASLKGGGKLVELLDRLAEDIRELQELRDDLITNTNLYVLFIVFTVAVGTPLLLAVSFHFSNLVSELQRTPVSGGSDLSGTGLSLVISSPLSEQFVFAASLVVIVLTSLLASALIGAVREGQELSGLKYAPFLVLASLFVFYIMRDFVLKFLRAT